MTQHPHSWDISGKDENSNLKRYIHPNVHCSTIYNSQDMKATQVPTDRWTHKEVTYVYNGVLVSLKKVQNTAICNNMDGCRDYHANIRGYQLYVESKKQYNEPISKAKGLREKTNIVSKEERNDGIN